MVGINNLDLLSVGVAVAGIVILGFIVFFNNRKNLTNKTFLTFTIVGVFWSVFNFLFYEPNTPEMIILLLRIHMFFVVWYCFFLYQLLRIFSETEFKFSPPYKYFLIPIAVITSILALTPFVLSKVTSVAADGRVSTVANGPAIYWFGAVILYLIIGGIISLIRKIVRATGLHRRQYVFILIGISITFSLHIVFNFILPAFFNEARFVPFGAVFLFPFIAFTAYAILKHHLLNIKVIATEILAFALAVVSLFEVLLSGGVAVLIFRSGVFLLVLSFGILLIRSVFREVEQRERLQKLTEELEAANAKLEELSRFKTQLLSLASHQVKSPLAAIKGFASILIDGLYGPVAEKIKETLRKIISSADDLIALINTFLDLRKVEEGKMEYEFAPTQIKNLVLEVFENLKPLAAEKKLKFTLGVQSEAIVNADAQKLKQVIQNLIDNAIKYTPTGSAGSPQGSFVMVELKDVGNEVVFSVSDSGLGIPADLLPYLFEEFIRDERVKKEIRGTGLGLFIARSIIEAHGGKLWAESAGEGKGSKFCVALKKIT